MVAPPLSLPSPLAATEVTEPSSWKMLTEARKRHGLENRQFSFFGLKSKMEGKKEKWGFKYSRFFLKNTWYCDGDFFIQTLWSCRRLVLSSRNLPKLFSRTFFSKLFTPRSHLRRCGKLRCALLLFLEICKFGRQIPISSSSRFTKNITNGVLGSGYVFVAYRLFTILRQMCVCSAEKTPLPALRRGYFFPSLLHTLLPKNHTSSPPLLCIVSCDCPNPPSLWVGISHTCCCILRTEQIFLPSPGIWEVHSIGKYSKLH